MSVAPEFAGLADPLFFARTGPHTLGTVAAACGIERVEGAPAELWLTGIAPLQNAGAGEVSVLHNRLYAGMLRQSRASAVIVAAAFAAQVPAGMAALVARDPHAAWARVASLFHPPPPIRPSIHPSAQIDPLAEIDPSCEIGPLVVVGAGARIGARGRIAAGAIIGPNVRIGPDCRIGEGASVTHAVLGARVSLHPGARIGQEGFGFAVTADGMIGVPQLGRAILHDDVAVGANSCVDRGGMQDTVIGQGSRLDNLVQIAHNVRLGRFCVVAAMAGISGSTVLEDFVQVGAQAGLTGHIRIGAGAKIGAQSGVMSDVPRATAVVGSPALPMREFFRNVAVLRQLARKEPVKETPKATAPKTTAPKTTA